MKTSDLGLSLGGAFAYLPGKNYFPQKVFILGVRPQTNGRWGSTNVATVCVARRLGWGKDQPANPDEGNWAAEWVRPAQIIRTWAQQTDLNFIAEETNARFLAARKAQQDAFTARFDAIPPALIEALDIELDSQRAKGLRFHGRTSIQMTLEILEALASMIAIKQGV